MNPVVRPHRDSYSFIHLFFHSFIHSLTLFKTENKIARSTNLQPILNLHRIGRTKTCELNVSQLSIKVRW